jgi:DNA (cytosine-5)-methyltransferase 1|tara:strand:+ start:511 stop:1722 length:1212 start_codon:yes stop_codon:yes gene_type:complete
MSKKNYSIELVADMLSTSKYVVNQWVKNKSIRSIKPNGKTYIPKNELKKFDKLSFLFSKNKFKKPKPKKNYKIIELFAGCGGLALGLEKAGFKCVMSNDIDKDSCDTLKFNRPKWNVLHKDISKISNKEFLGYKDVDVVSGGFPCQAFSYAGKKLGFEDTRGTLFYEFARVVKIIKPLICIAENVRGLTSHDQGKTLSNIINVMEEIGYDVVNPEICQAIFYEVPQKRERLFLIGIKKRSGLKFTYPNKISEPYTVRDALKKGRLYKTNVPNSNYQKYTKRKQQIMRKVPPGGNWNDLPEKMKKEYMKGSLHLGGGKTGIARRLGWDEPSLTLTTAPAMKQTERAHPKENRPLSIREYARIQTFPDNWKFSGTLNSKYKQIGNAVPVNLAEYIGYELIRSLNK